MDSPLTAEEYQSALAALTWQIELGVETCIGEDPVNRYEMPAPAPAAPSPAPTPPPPVPQRTQPAPATPAAPPRVQAADPVAEARAMADAAGDLAALRTAMEAYPHFELKKGARNLVFADGTPGARVMIVGEAPGRDEDREGRPFVGRAGQLLDRMLAAIDLTRAQPGAGDAPERGSVYITNVLPYRPPQNRDPKPDEIEMMLPFLHRHIALAAPEILLIMGNISCQALLGKRGITRLRGTWTTAAAIPALPMFHPAYLLRNPSAKREAWADLLSVRARLDG